MEKLTFKEIKEIIESELFDEHGVGPEAWMEQQVYHSVQEITDEHSELKPEYAKLGFVECVDSYGGEGEGDDYYSVYRFFEHDVFIKFQGWYQSFNGSEYDHMLEVRPKEVTITKYVAVPV